MCDFETVRLAAVVASMITGIKRLAAVAFVFSLTACASRPALPEGVYLQDDFSSARSGWQVHEDSDGFLRYIDGAYVVRINSPRIVLWGLSAAEQTFSDVRINTVARDESEVFEVSFGVICNYADADNFYLFEIGPDGFYRIVNLEDGVQHVLAGEELSPDIGVGQDVYWLQVECGVGEQGLYVDGTEIARTQADTHRSGDGGRVPHSYERGGAGRHFDQHIHAGRT